MSWLYVPGLPCCPKESGPHSSFLDTKSEPCATWSGKPLLPANWSRLWKRESSIRRLSGVICEPSTADAGVVSWISSRRDFLARTYPLQESDQGWMAGAAASSSKSFASQRIAVRDGSFWKTLQVSLAPQLPLWTKKAPPSTSGITTPKAFRKWALKMAAYSKERPPESWENWPTAGGTRSGSLFPRPMWVPATGGRDGSASLGEENWPTPVANDDNKTPEAHMAMKSRMKGGPRNTITSLQVKVQTNWLTPHGMGGIDSTGKLGAGGEFAKQATQWLTPNAPNGGRSVPAELVASKGTTEDSEAAGGAGTIQRGARGHSLNSSTQAWPTPASRDHKGTDLPSRRGGASLSHATQTGVFSHSSPPAQPIHDGQESSPAGPGSPRRLNPAFGCWLMGLPCWWTNPGLTSFAKSEMELYRSRQQQHLSCLFDEHRGG